MRVRWFVLHISVLSFVAAMISIGSAHSNERWSWQRIGNITYVPGYFINGTENDPYWQEKFRQAADAWEPGTSIAHHPQNTDGSELSRRFLWYVWDDPESMDYGYANSWDKDHDGWISTADCRPGCDVPDMAVVRVNKGSLRRACEKRNLTPAACADFELSTVTHEIGHLLRLDHNNLESVMNPLVDHPRLQPHDTEDIQSYYPR